MTGTDSTIAPFDRHPAVLTELTGTADRLEGLGGTSLDLRSLTDQRYRPAELNWDGVGSAELAAAPQSVRRDATQASDAMVWLAGTLRYWRSQVDLFNGRVDAILAERASAAANNWGVSVTSPTFETDTQVARTNLDRRLREQWWSAHQQYIDEGSRTAATMLRDGPTADNLRLLADAGVWRSPSGAVALLLPFWQDQAMKQVATDLAELAARINDPWYQPTDEELAELEEVLSQYADDPAFAYYFLSELGAEGLLLLTGNVALAQTDPPGNDEDFRYDPELARILGSIQTSLGIALATATTRRGAEPAYPGMRYVPGQYELDSDWKTDLLVAGGQIHAVGDPNSHHRYLEVYGYQLLGVLLHSGDYDSHFLSLAGGMMIDFEQSQGGTEFWLDQAGGENARLNWIVTDGTDDRAPAGYDPMIGLMSALDRNPEGALALLTDSKLFGDGPDYAIDPPDGYRLPRLDYLLTDREWPMDRITGISYFEINNEDYDNYVNPGLVQFGSVLEQVAALDDPRAVQVVESIVYELNVDEQAMGYRNGQEVGDGRTQASIGHNLMHPQLREPIANIMADYIWDVNRAVDSTGSGMPGGRGATFDETHMLRLLTDLGKDEQAHQTVREAQAVYTAASYDYYLSGAAGLQPDNLDQRIHAAEQVARRYGSVVGALDYGGITQEWYEQLAADRQHNQRVNNNYMVAGFIVDKIVGKTVGSVPIAGDLAGPFIKGILNEAQQAAQVDNSGLVTYTVADALSGGAQTSSDLATAALYHSGQLPGLPPELIQADGTPKPMSEWTASDLAAWNAYTDTTGHGTVPRLGNTAADAYEDGVERANNRLNQDVFNN